MPAKVPATARKITWSVDFSGVPGKVNGHTYEAPNDKLKANLLKLLGCSLNWTNGWGRAGLWFQLSDVAHPMLKISAYNQVRLEDKEVCAGVHDGQAGLGGCTIVVADDQIPDKAQCQIRLLANIPAGQSATEYTVKQRALPAGLRRP